VKRVINITDITPLERSRRRWEGNIKMDKKWDGEAWTGLIRLRIRTDGGIL